MGYSLQSNNKHFYANTLAFSKLLHLAYIFGWHPRGTEPPSFDEGGSIPIGSCDWDGSYFGNSFQFVTEEDAKEIAVSLKKSLQYIPDTYEGESLRKLVDECMFLGRKEFDQMSEGEKDQFLSAFTGLEDYLKKFIDFCEDGGFLVS